MSYILLIEDNQENADMTVRILNSANYEVKHCMRGFDGAKLARQERPALILMDFDLPDIDGRTMTLMLRKQLGQNAPPVVAVTARAGANEVRLAEQFGCQGFISKPFTPDELLNIVRQVIQLTETDSDRDRNNY
jgi:two-component system cell cycle response regulator DivK